MTDYRTYEALSQQRVTDGLPPLGFDKLKPEDMTTVQDPSKAGMVRRQQPGDCFRGPIDTAPTTVQVNHRDGSVTRVMACGNTVATVRIPKAIQYRSTNPKFATAETPQFSYAGPNVPADSVARAELQRAFGNDPGAELWEKCDQVINKPDNWSGGVRTSLANNVAASRQGERRPVTDPQVLNDIAGRFGGNAYAGEAAAARRANEFLGI